MKKHLLSTIYQLSQHNCGTNTPMQFVTPPTAGMMLREPASYKPNRIEIYYADNADTPHISYENGAVKYVNLPPDVGQSQVIQVWIDGNCIYVEVEGQIILNKLGDVQLPQPKVTASTIANSLRQTRN